MLCPEFWTLPPEPDIHSCPRVRRNILSPNDGSLVRDMQSQLVHELAHLHGVGGGSGTNGLGWRMGQYEPYLLQEAVDLSAEASINNAQNFAFYYAGELQRFKENGEP